MIVVLGSVNIDICLEVESLPRAGETIHARDRGYSGGGKGANQVLAAKRGGAEVAFFGAVGSDRHAEEALCDIVEAGIPISDIAVVQEETGSANIYVDRHGENCIVVVAGANGLVGADAVAAAVKRASDGFLVLQQEIPFATTHHALKRARASGTRTILNVSPFDKTSAELSRLADIVIANQHEWSQLSGGAETCAAMQEWSRRHRQTIVVTKGAGGVAVASPSEYFEVAAPTIQPIDTVGAVDTFCGYLAAELDRGGSLREATEIAVTAASIACLKAGAQASISVKHEVLNAREQHHAS
ncbi:ribokinase [Phyllobacterium sp. SB3]|uniref:ribokinase n=1 Tax=Phyllobacterium sp. SB3 TaxID=3156073 RepID=UPI0032AEA9C9